MLRTVNNTPASTWRVRHIGRGLWTTNRARSTKTWLAVAAEIGAAHGATQSVTRAGTAPPTAARHWLALSR